MGSYKIEWKGSAEKELRKLDPLHIRQIIQLGWHRLRRIHYPRAAENFTERNISIVSAQVTTV